MLGWWKQFDHIFLLCAIAPMESGFCHAQIQRNEMSTACENFAASAIYRLMKECDGSRGGKGHKEVGRFLVEKAHALYLRSAVV
jgi:hypothetical protein